MTGFDDVRSAVERGDEAEAIAAMESAAAAGDADAAFVLANWRLYAMYGPRDPAQARALLAQAGEAGHVEALRTLASLTANGIGGPADPEGALGLMERIADADPYAALQLRFLGGMMSPEDARGRPRELLSENPRIEIVRGLLLPEECRYLILVAEPSLQPSFVVDPETGERRPHPVRTSLGAALGPVQEDLVANAINRRIAGATATDYGCGEPLHILRYAPGQEYRPHVDALPGVDNQRVVTALLYLNEDYEGGETRFPELDLDVRGRTGDLLIFHNLTAEGDGDPRTRHAGLPVASGAKWLATRWIRQRPHDPFEDGHA